MGFSKGDVDDVGLDDAQPLRRVRVGVRVQAGEEALRRIRAGRKLVGGGVEHDAQVVDDDAAGEALVLGGARTDRDLVVFEEVLRQHLVEGLLADDRLRHLVELEIAGCQGLRYAAKRGCSSAISLKMLSEASSSTVPSTEALTKICSTASRARVIATSMLAAVQRRPM